MTISLLFIQLKQELDDFLNEDALKQPDEPALRDISCLLE
jgi:hypothetical protein